MYIQSIPIHPCYFGLSLFPACAFKEVNLCACNSRRVSGAAVSALSDINTAHSRLLRRSIWTAGIVCVGCSCEAVLSLGVIKGTGFPLDRLPSPPRPHSHRNTGQVWFFPHCFRHIGAVSCSLYVHIYCVCQYPKVAADRLWNVWFGCQTERVARPSTLWNSSSHTCLIHTFPPTRWATVELLWCRPLTLAFPVNGLSCGQRNKCLPLINLSSNAAQTRRVDVWGVFLWLTQHTLVAVFILDEWR